MNGILVHFELHNCINKYIKNQTNYSPRSHRCKRGGNSLVHSNGTSGREMYERGNNCGIPTQTQSDTPSIRCAATVFSSVSYRLRNFYQTEWDKVHQTYQEEADKYRMLMEQQVRVQTQWNSDLVSFNLRACSYLSIVVTCMGFYCHTHSHTFFLNSS